MTTGSHQAPPLSDTLVFPLGSGGSQFMMSRHITSTAWTSEHDTELGLHNPLPSQPPTANILGVSQSDNLHCDQYSCGSGPCHYGLLWCHSGPGKLLSYL